MKHHIHLPYFPLMNRIKMIFSIFNGSLSGSEILLNLRRSTFNRPQPPMTHTLNLPISIMHECNIVAVLFGTEFIMRV